MLNPIIEAKTVEKVNEMIDASNVIAIFTHKSPDGDAIGSTLSLAHYLEQRGKFVSIYVPNAFPDFLHWLPGSQKIIQYDKHQSTVEKMIAKTDLAFCLDFNELSRIETLGEVLGNSKCKKILIDHHLNPGDFADVSISFPEMSSTCELVYRLFEAIGFCNSKQPLPKNIATCIYCGMMTDTGGFVYNSNRSEIYSIISNLLASGINKDKIYRNVFNNYSVSRFKLMGFILYEKLNYSETFHSSIITLSREEQKQFNYMRGDTEGIVNIPLQIKGAKFSVFLREDTESGAIRVSLRSVDDFPCNKVAAEFFNGGGHLNASGGELHCSLEEAVAIAKQSFVKYEALLTKK